VPAPVRCLELPDAHPLHHAALAALLRFGAAPVEALLAALDDGGATEGRAQELAGVAGVPQDSYDVMRGR
jgi:hypothetical protein